MTTPTLSKAERVAIGGVVAPIVRRAAGAPRAPRKVTVVGKDGKPVGETTSVEVAKAVLARSGIEFSVQSGKRPKWVKCEACGHPIKVLSTGNLPTKCRPDALTPCNRIVATPEERAADLEKIKSFARERGLSEEWAMKVYMAKHGDAHVG